MIVCFIILLLAFMVFYFLVVRNMIYWKLGCALHPSCDCLLVTCIDVLLVWDACFGLVGHVFTCVREHVWSS